MVSRRERYSYIMLVVLCILCTVLSVFFSFRHADADERHVCALMDVTINHPAIKPADPEKDPSRELTYEKYLAVLQVARIDGCPKNAVTP